MELSPIDFYIGYDNTHNHYNPNSKTIGYDPNNNIRKDGKVRPPEAALAHELGHAENDKNGTAVKYDKDVVNGTKKATSEQVFIEKGKQDKNEANSIYYENIVREKEGYPQRGYIYSNGD